MKKYNSNMFDPHVQQQHQNLQEISVHMTSSESDFEMRNENEDSSGNEKVAAPVEVEAPPLTDDQRSMKQPKRDVYHRHNQHQIQQMEAFYQEDAYPNSKQRRMLASVIGLTPRQVKFWFQKKHTQIKTEREREENERLRVENERIVAESERYEEALSKASCSICGGPTSNNISEMSYEEKRLRIENGILKDEIARMLGRPNNNAGSFVTSFFNKPPQN